MEQEMKNTIIGASVGDCIHVAGLLNFLQLAESSGFQVIFLGPAVSLDNLIAQIRERRPEIVAISYRLSSKSLSDLLGELKKRRSSEHSLHNSRYVFGGTVETAQVARQQGFFEKVFDGTESIEEIVSFLRGTLYKEERTLRYPDNLLDRIALKYPVPLLRHHIGLSSVQETIEGVKEIAEAKVLDIISLAPDQTAQQYFFKADKLKTKSIGAGGVPLRERDDLIKIYEASRCGNYPLLRCYSGTDDIFKWAELQQETIKNAWCAIPLSWYNMLDRRSSRSLLNSIKEAQGLMKWHADRGIPVEVNEAHQWSLRRAPDTIAVATAFLAAYNAKQSGVKHYISQYMFNTPAQISPRMDLAKMLAKIDMIEGLHDNMFHSYRQIRPGLLSYPTDLDAAKGQLSYSIMLSLMLKPHIVHVVAYCEGQYAARPKEIIESCKIVNNIIQNYMKGFPENLLIDHEIQQQKEKLKEEAKILLEAIRKLGGRYKDPLTSPEVLAKAIKLGLVDAPDLKGNEEAKGEISTGIIDGTCVAIDSTGRALSEKERIKKIMGSVK